MTTFPATQRSLVEALRDTDLVQRERVWEMAARVYRSPLVAVVRYRWPMLHDEAEDLVHDFLLHAWEKEWFRRYDPQRGRFRTFLRTLLDAFAATRHEASTRLKRGGGMVHVPLEVAQNHADESTAESIFDREWVRSVLATALETFRAECLGDDHAVRFAVFLAHDVHSADADRVPTYAELASRFALPLTQVTNHLNWARRRFRAHVMQTLCAMTASDDEYRAEARALLGMAP